MSSFVRFALSIGATALFTGCGVSQPQIGVPDAMPQSRAVTTHADRGESWMLRDAGKIKKLAYLSDHGGVVHVHAYPSGRIVGKLTGFESPGGQCVDTAGDVYITDFAATTVVEYAHGGKKALKTLSTGGSPDACSVAPNGDLAVANSHTASGGGDIAVFRNGSGSPKYYANSSCDLPAALGYDGRGNLYIQTAYSSTVCEIAKGARAMSVVNTNVSFNSPIGVMWDGKHITFADDYYYGTVTETVIYQMKESSSGGLVEVGKTVLTGTCYYDRNVVFQPFILGAANTPGIKKLATLVFGPNTWCDRALFTWAYPGGGNPQDSFKVSSSTYGQSISIAE